MAQNSSVANESTVQGMCCWFRSDLRAADAGGAYDMPPSTLGTGDYDDDARREMVRRQIAEEIAERQGSAPSSVSEYKCISQLML